MDLLIVERLEPELFQLQVTPRLASVTREARTRRTRAVVRRIVELPRRPAVEPAPIRQP